MLESLQSHKLIMLSEIDWSHLWQRHQIFASLFAQSGFETLYLNRTGMRLPGVRELPYLWQRVLEASKGSQAPATSLSGEQVESGLLRIMNPLVLPPTSGFLRWLNQTLFIPRLARALEKNSSASPILYTYLPTWTTLQLINQINPYCVIYDCVHNFEDHPRAPHDITVTEDLLLQRAEVVVTDSAYLADKLGQKRPDVVRIPPGVDYDNFARAYRGNEAERIRTICYFGLIKPELDLSLMTALLAAGYRLQLIGLVDPYIREQLPAQAELIGFVDHAHLPQTLYDCDAILLPYQLNAFSQAIMPAKTFECLATGKPIIATALPDLVQYQDLIHIVSGPEEMLAALDKIPSMETPARARARMEIARENSWQKRFQLLLSAISLTCEEVMA